MPIASPGQYAGMLDAARADAHALAAVNVTSSQTMNAAMRGFAEAEADGIVQITPGAAAYLSGVDDAAAGARALAALARELADGYPVLVALHTDHCPPEQVPDFLGPLLGATERRRRQGEEPLFNSHMFDGSSLSLEENLASSASLLARCRSLDVVLEVECGVVGGEEDGLRGGGEPADLYTTPADLLRVAQALGTGERGRYLLAATFGNVHGRPPAGSVKLRPEILREGQRALAAIAAGARFDYVFHGSSGSSERELREAISFGVVKVNVDTDMQHAFTGAVAEHLQSSFDPRSWGRPAEAAMAERVAEACAELGSAGHSLAS